eukprot:759644_1
MYSCSLLRLLLFYAIFTLVHVLGIDACIHSITFLLSLLLVGDQYLAVILHSVSYRYHSKPTSPSSIQTDSSPNFCQSPSPVKSAYRMSNSSPASMSRLAKR